MGETPPPNLVLKQPSIVSRDSVVDRLQLGGSAPRGWPAAEPALSWELGSTGKDRRLLTLPGFSPRRLHSELCSRVSPRRSSRLPRGRAPAYGAAAGAQPDPPSHRTKPNVHVGGEEAKAGGHRGMRPGVP